MTQETEREAFEKAAKLEGLNVARHRIGHDDYDCDNTQWRWLGFKHGLMQARARLGKGEVERDSISAEEIKGWRLDPKVHDAILNRADPFSVAWHQREKEHQAALSAKAKPVEPTEFEIALKAREMEKEYNEQFGSDALRPDFLASAKLALSESSEAKPVEVSDD